MRKMNQFMMGMLAIAATAFTSCSTDDTTSPMTGRESVENFYMKLQITGNAGNSTRTDGTSTEDGTKEESTIKSGTIWLVAPDGSVAFSKQLTAADWDDTNNTNTKPIKVAVTQVEEKTEYKVYFLANKTDYRIDPTKDFAEQTLTSTTGGLDYAQKDAFVMFNQNDKSVKANQYTVKFQPENKDAATPATPANAIKLDRVTARIDMPTSVTEINKTASKNTNTVNIDAIKSVTLQSYAPFNVASNENMEQKWNATWDIMELPTPFGTLHQPIGAFGNGHNISNPPAFLTDKTYIFENTNDDPALATGIFLKYKATAETTANIDFTDGTFYRYDKHVFTSIKDVITFAGAANPFGALTADQVVALIADKTDATKLTSDEDAIEDFRKAYNIEVFERGEVYYNYSIEDTHHTGKKYSVLRNSIYQIKVKTIYDLGTDTPNTPPTTPNYYLNVEVTVNPWVLNVKEIELE